MINSFLILFFGSLIGIIFMIGRKLIVLQSGEVLYKNDTVLADRSLEEWKHATIKSIRKGIDFGLVVTIRFYVRFSNFLSKKYQVIKIKLQNKFGKKGDEIKNEEKEPSRFLKVVTEYKHKIRKIKHQIKREEENS